MLRRPRALFAAPKPALFGFKRLWFTVPSALNWLFTIVRFVGLVNCAVVFRPFTVADGVLQLLADGIRQQMRDATPEARNFADQLIRQANARALHLLAMQIQQPR